MSKPVLLKIMWREIEDVDQDLDWMCDMVYEALHKPTEGYHFNMVPTVLQRLIKKTQRVSEIINQIKKLQETIDVLETKQLDIKNAYKTYCEKQDGEINVYEIEEFDNLYAEVKDLLNFLTQLNHEWPKLDPTRKEEKQK